MPEVINIKGEMTPERVEVFKKEWTKLIREGAYKKVPITTVPVDGFSVKLPLDKKIGSTEEK